MNAFDEWLSRLQRQRDEKEDLLWTAFRRLFDSNFVPEPTPY